MIKTNTKGFTIIEILLALAFFAFILGFIVAGFVFVSRSYTSGIIVKEVQENARLLLDDITRELRVANDADGIVFCSEFTNDACTAAGAPDVNRLCIGDDLRYGWNVSDPNSSIPIGSKLEPLSIWKLSDSLPCSDPVNATDAVSPIASGLDIFAIDVQQVGGSDAYSVEIVMAPTGEPVLNNVGDFVCQFVAGPEAAYCRVVTVRTVVKTLY